MSLFADIARALLCERPVPETQCPPANKKGFARRPCQAGDIKELNIRADSVRPLLTPEEQILWDQLALRADRSFEWVKETMENKLSFLGIFPLGNDTKSLNRFVLWQINGERRIGTTFDSNSLDRIEGFILGDDLKEKEK